MLMEQSIEKMHKMKLHKMAESFKEKLSAPQYKDLSHEEFLGILIDLNLRLFLLTTFYLNF